MLINKTNYSIDHFLTSQDISLNRGKNRPADRLNHLSKSCEHVAIEGDILEFGVFQGNTIRVIAEHFPNDTVHGFDSFEGLPEDWDLGHTVMNKKMFDRAGILPEVPDNVKFWIGWFDQTIPKYIGSHVEPIKLLHVDCDLYSSTKTIFDSLNDRIVKGTVIVLDDFYPFGKIRYDNWPDGEYKALQEWVETYNRQFTVLSHNRHQQCAILIG